MLTWRQWLHILILYQYYHAKKLAFLLNQETFDF